MAGAAVTGSWLNAAEVYDPDSSYPALTGTTPAAAAVGKSVVVDGHHLAGSAAAWLDGVPAPISGASDTQLTLKVPSGALSGPIEVLTPAGPIWSAFVFKVKPAVKGFTPTAGPPGTTVTITGTAFTGATKVLIGTKKMTFLVNSSTKITAIIPAGATTGAISVVTPGGKGKSETDFTVT